MRAPFPVLAAILACTLASASAAPIFDPGPYLHAQRLVDIGGRRLNIYCTGTGSPTVILDAGLGGSTDSWRFVQSSIAQKTRTCSYDRAGMGFSDPASSQRDAAAVVDDLHALLQAAQVPPPYVLVGHSIAGLYDRLYVDRYRSDVAGMVLVDPVSTDTVDAKDTAIYTSCAQAAENHELNLNTALFGECGLLTNDQLRQGCDADGPAECELDQLDNERARSVVVLKAVASEADSYNISTAEVLREERNYGSLPLIVLTRAQSGNSWKAWKTDHDHVASLSSEGKNFVVVGSGHSIQIDHPAAVIWAIGKVLDQVRSHPNSAKAAGR